MKKKREYTYCEEDILTINPQQHYDFIENYQKAIFLSLAEKNLLTTMQCEQCIDELERQRKGYFNEIDGFYERVRGYGAALGIAAGS